METGTSSLLISQIIDCNKLCCFVSIIGTRQLRVLVPVEGKIKQLLQVQHTIIALFYSKKIKVALWRLTFNSLILLMQSEYYRFCIKLGVYLHMLSDKTLVNWSSPPDCKFLLKMMDDFSRKFFTNCPTF